MKMCPPFNEMQQELVKLLLRNSVVFLVIGGHAVRAYLPHRKTSDLDILLSRSRGNARKLANAFEQHQLPQGKKWEDILTRSGIRLTYPHEQNKEADLLTSIEGIGFGKCYASSVEVEFGDVKLRIPYLTDLIEMKKKSLASGNDVTAKQKDEMDIKELQELPIN